MFSVLGRGASGFFTIEIMGLQPPRTPPPPFLHLYGGG